MEKRYRKVIIHGKHFPDFYARQGAKLRDKIKYVFEIIETSEKVPVKFLKRITGAKGLYEIRIGHQGNIYRVFCCFDRGCLVVLFNAFQKKTQKTPTGETMLATKLMEEYTASKNT